MKKIHQCDFDSWGWKLVMTKSDNKLVWKEQLYVPWCSAQSTVPST